MTDPLELHFSAIRMLQDCGEQYRRRYVKGEKIPPGIAILIGIGTHAAIATDLNRKIDTGELAPQDEIKTVARDVIAEYFADGNFSLSRDERALKAKRAWRDETIDMAVVLSALHHQRLAPNIRPIKNGIERSWLVDVPAEGFKLGGTLDIQERSCVRDTKTAGQTPPRDAADRSDQLTMYALAVKVLDGKAPKSVRLDALVKLKTPKVVSLESERTDEDFRVLLARVTAAITAIRAGIFVPANRDYWKCAPKFCGFYETCPFVRGHIGISMTPRR